MRNLIIFLITIIFTSCSQQKSTEEMLLTHVSYLAADDLEGREAGTTGEEKAAEYIVQEFEKTGLKPKGEEGYIQKFEFLAGKNMDGTSFSVNGNEIDNSSYFPMNFSGNGLISSNSVNVKFGIEAEELSYNDYQNLDPVDKVVWISISSPDGIHPHSQYLNYHSLKERARLAQEKGASGVVFYNNDETAQDPSPRYTENVTALNIPVVFYTESTFIEGPVDLSVNLVEDRRTAQNVIGYLDNGSDYNIIVGAHFDHLGYGQSGGSLYRGETKEIHNGADDNASGTALLIEMAKEINSSEIKGHNFLFIAFSGEEKGLLGANYFVENPTIDLTTVSYMINMDMVGRLDTATHELAINGVGTSPAWSTVITEIDNGYFDISTSESGVGPSDHTSFYLADIPVLHFFTGTHEDYHKPTDDYEKINVEGMMEVNEFIMQIHTKLNDSTKITFTKTQDSQARSAPRFSVTLGVVPDYMYNDGGLKIDGVSDGKPAEVAGIQSGDIVVRMGDQTIDDIYAYMDALSKYKKGDEIEIVFKRDGEEKSTTVKF